MRNFENKKLLPSIVIKGSGFDCDIKRESQFPKIEDRPSRSCNAATPKQKNRKWQFSWMRSKKRNTSYTSHLRPKAFSGGKWTAGTLRKLKKKFAEIRNFGLERRETNWISNLFINSAKSRLPLWIAFFLLLKSNRAEIGLKILMWKMTSRKVLYLQPQWRTFNGRCLGRIKVRGARWVEILASQRGIYQHRTSRRWEIHTSAHINTG